MDVQQAILGRRSIRKYKDTPVKDEDILDILNAGLAAPSAVNLQPWYFIVMKSKESREELMRIMEQVSRKLVPILQDSFPKHPDVVEETRRFVDDLGNAPVCILVFQYKQEYNKKPDTIIQSVAAAIQNMIIMAQSKGIGSCWLTAVQETNMEEELKKRYAPEKGGMVAMVTFGYADQQPKELPRKENRYIII